MAIDDIKKIYQDILIVQYRDKPNALNTIATIVDTFVSLSKILSIQDLLNIDTQTGAQLDIIGKIVGCKTRYCTVDNVSVRLNDPEFRIAIKIKILQKSLSVYSVPKIQELINAYIIEGVYVSDEDFAIKYILDTDKINLNIINYLIQQKILPKPMGIKLIVYKKTNDKKLQQRKTRVGKTAG